MVHDPSAGAADSLVTEWPGALAGTLAYEEGGARSGEEGADQVVEVPTEEADDEGADEADDELANELAEELGRRLGTLLSVKGDGEPCGMVSEVERLLVGKILTDEREILLDEREGEVWPNLVAFVLAIWS